MSLVYNVDGWYRANDPADHCRHGVYVGGCGYDFMCMACELGDPDPTPNDLRASISQCQNKVYQRWILWLRVLEFCPPEMIRDFGPKLPELLANTDEARALKGLLQGLDEALQWAENDEDDTWLSRRHDFEIRKYHEPDAML